MAGERGEESGQSVRCGDACLNRFFEFQRKKAAYAAAYQLTTKEELSKVASCQGNHFMIKF